MLGKARVKGLQFVLNTALTEIKHVALEKGNWGLSEKLLRETQEMDSDPFKSIRTSVSLSLQPPSRTR